jgi:uncharacterized protein
MNSSTGASASTRRIELIDIIRGFALLGIFFVNIPEMWGKGYAFVSEYVGTDAIVRLLYDMFVQTKFYTLFAFLFGLSFYLFMQSAERKGIRPKAAMARRLALLLFVGSVHFFFIWFGDVLMGYAITGFLLLLFYGRKAKTILTWSFVLLGLAFLVLPLGSWVASVAAPELIDTTFFSAVPGIQERVDFFFEVGIANLIGFIPEILGLFLLGMYAGMKGWFSGDGLSNSVLARVQWITLGLTVAIFIPMILHYTSVDTYKPGLVMHWIYLSGKTLAVFYLVTLIRIVRVWGASRLSGLASLGKMAFTNYLLQSIITMSIYYYVTTQVGTWSLAYNALYAVAFLTLQILLSGWWLRHFRMGPFEWVWRAGTYGQLPTIKKEKAASPHSFSA